MTSINNGHDYGQYTSKTINKIQMIPNLIDTLHFFSEKKQAGTVYFFRNKLVLLLLEQYEETKRSFIQFCIRPLSLSLSL